MRETHGKFAPYIVATRVVGGCLGDGGKRKREVRERGGGRERVSGSRGAFS